MYSSVLKPLFDRVFALLLLALLSPLLILLCLIIMIDSKGSPIFVQKRIGKGCNPFKIYKLRTMVLNAEKVGPYFTSSNDSRVTRLGRILRKTSLDEIPQVLNILFGQMSFIGPRPDTPVQEKDYLPEQWQKRHLVLPGITGLAQSTLRSKATPEQRTNLDLKYVDDVSLSLDLKILMDTFKVVLIGKNTN